jgi:hypothetical protein
MAGMGRGSWTRLGVLALAMCGAGAAACSSTELPSGSGGSGGLNQGTAGSFPGIGGAGVGGTGVGGNGVGGRGVGGTGMGGRGVGGAGVGGTGMGGALGTDGSCTAAHVNPDFTPGGACATDCQSLSCGKPCTEDCCVSCGIDQSGAKRCSCPNPGGPYDNCSCLPPPFIPPGLLGGPCTPQGYSTPTVPVTAPAGSIALRGLPCRAANLVCFTADSTASAERGCICLADGLMHCGSVNHWFVNTGTPTAWMP